MLYLNKETEKQSETDLKTRQAEITSVGDGCEAWEEIFRAVADWQIEKMQTFRYFRVLDHWQPLAFDDVKAVPIYLFTMTRPLKLFQLARLSTFHEWLIAAC